MATVSKADRILTVDDAADILEELLAAQHRSFLLGLKLKLPLHEVEAIHQRYPEPRDCLLHTIITFLRRTEPKPTWRVIVDALKNATLGLPALARKLEAAHFPPNTTETHEKTADTDSVCESKPSPNVATVKGEVATNSPITKSHEVNKIILELSERFDTLKDSVRECLESRKTLVTKVADVLTSLSPDGEDQHKLFTKENKSDLFNAASIPELFGTMNFHWNYLDPTLLEHLVTKLNLKQVKDEMEAYNSDLQQFRTKTPLTIFCASQEKRHIDPPQDFRKFVAQFKWPKNATLEDVEQFRKEYAHKYNLHKCAMMLAQIQPGSVMVTWFIPVSIEEKLKENVPIEIFRKYFITTVKIAKACVYQEEVSGPGLTSATVNHPTHILVELTDSSGRPYSPSLNITAQLQLVSKTTPTSQPEATPTRTKQLVQHVSVAMTSPSRYEVSYTPVSRGQHKLHVQVNDREINGSPFTVTVYPDPRQLSLPVRTVTGLVGPYAIAFNSHQEMIVSECGGRRLSIFDIRGQKIGTFGSNGDSPDQMISPRGITTNDVDNINIIYFSSEHKLQKFTSGGELIKCVGKKGRKEGEFDVPRGVTLYDNQVYVCDYNNHRIQVFDLDLNFVRSIGPQCTGLFNTPYDVKFDTAGNMYVADYCNKRVQVLDTSGSFIRAFGIKELKGPTGLLIVDKYVYVSDQINHCIVVYETSGQFITTFGSHGRNEGEFKRPYCVTSSADGDILCVCDLGNGRVQIF